MANFLNPINPQNFGMNVTGNFNNLGSSATFQLPNSDIYNKLQLVESMLTPSFGPIGTIQLSDGVGSFTGNSDFEVNIDTVNDENVLTIGIDANSKAALVMTPSMPPTVSVVEGTIKFFGTDLQCFKGAGWVSLTGTAGATVSGADTWIQYNNGGAFGSSGNFTFTSGSGTLSVPNLLATSTLKANVSLQLEETGGGTDVITIQAPVSLTLPYTLTLPVDDGSSGEFLQTDGSGVLTWAATAAQVAGANTQIQYNDSGAFGANSDFTWVNTTKTLNLGNSSIANSTSADAFLFDALAKTLKVGTLAPGNKYDLELLISDQTLQILGEPDLTGNLSQIVSGYSLFTQVTSNQTKGNTALWLVPPTFLQTYHYSGHDYDRYSSLDPYEDSILHTKNLNVGQPIQTMDLGMSSRIHTSQRGNAGIPGYGYGSSPGGLWVGPLGDDNDFIVDPYAEVSMGGYPDWAGQVQYKTSVPGIYVQERRWDWVVARQNHTTSLQLRSSDRPSFNPIGGPVEGIDFYDLKIGSFDQGTFTNPPPGGIITEYYQHSTLGLTLSKNLAVSSRGTLSDDIVKISTNRIPNISAPLNGGVNFSASSQTNWGGGWLNFTTYDTSTGGALSSNIVMDGFGGEIKSLNKIESGIDFHNNAGGTPTPISRLSQGIISVNNNSGTQIASLAINSTYGELILGDGSNDKISISARNSGNAPRMLLNSNTATASDGELVVGGSSTVYTKMDVNGNIHASTTIGVDTFGSQYGVIMSASVTGGNILVSNNSGSGGIIRINGAPIITEGISGQRLYGGSLSSWIDIGEISGGAPVIKADGTLANEDMQIWSKGTGSIVLQNKDNSGLIIAETISLNIGPQVAGGSLTGNLLCKFGNSTAGANQGVGNVDFQLNCGNIANNSSKIILTGNLTGSTSVLGIHLQDSGLSDRLTTIGYGTNLGSFAIRSEKSSLVDEQVTVLRTDQSTHQCYIAQTDSGATSPWAIFLGTNAGANIVTGSSVVGPATYTTRNITSDANQSLSLTTPGSGSIVITSSISGDIIVGGVGSGDVKIQAQASIGTGEVQILLGNNGYINCSAAGTPATGSTGPTNIVNANHTGYIGTGSLIAINQTGLRGSTVITQTAASTVKIYVAPNLAIASDGVYVTASCIEGPQGTIFLRGQIKLAGINATIDLDAAIALVGTMIMPHNFPLTGWVAGTFGSMFQNPQVTVSNAGTIIGGPPVPPDINMYAMDLMFTPVQGIITLTGAPGAQVAHLIIQSQGLTPDIVVNYIVCAERKDTSYIGVPNSFVQDYMNPETGTTKTWNGGALPAQLDAQFGAGSWQG